MFSHVTVAPMQKLLFPIFFVFWLSALGQEVASIASVRAELEAMLVTDQSYRREVIELEKKHGSDSTEVKEAWARQGTIDSQNIRRLEEIIMLHGWPGRTQFGDKAASAAFLILQHSDLSYQKKHLPIARAAAANGEMRGTSLALLEDRIRIREGQKQIYGSQVTKNSVGDWEPLPLEDEDKVDALRSSVGLGPLSEYLQGFASRRGGGVSPKWMKKIEKERNQSSESTAPSCPGSP